MAVEVEEENVHALLLSIQGMLFSSVHRLSFMSLGKVKWK